MEISRETLVKFGFECNSVEAAVVANYSQRILGEEHSESLGEIPSPMRKILEALTAIAD